MWLRDLGPQPKPVPKGLLRVEQTILTQRDFGRYGLTKFAKEWPAKVVVVEYRRGTRLEFWTVMEAS